MAGGRPTKYKQDYCDLIIEALSEGKSIAAFAADIGVARSSVKEWADAYPEFSNALRIAKAKCSAWWENEARKVALAGGAPGQATMIIFGLKNMSANDWRDKHDVEVTGKDGGPVRIEKVVWEVCDPEGNGNNE